jgi:hypothetical protein
MRPTSGYPQQEKIYTDRNRKSLTHNHRAFARVLKFAAVKQPESGDLPKGCARLIPAFDNS